MRTLISILFLTATSITLATDAFADDPLTKPAFALMDNTGDGSKLDLDVAMIVPSDPNMALFRFNFLGQYVDQIGFGGYAGISISKLMSGGDSGPSSGLGGLELGGLYQHALTSDFGLGLRLGLILPTTNTEGAVVQLASTLAARPADVATIATDITWLRIGVSPTYLRGPVFLRADLGVDIPIIDGHGVDPVEHINLGAEITDDGFSVTAELQTVYLSINNANDKSSSSYHTAGVSVRYQGTRLSPFVSFSTLLEHGLLGESNTVTGGLTFPL